jgi:hypothetical protein
MRNLRARALLLPVLIALAGACSRPAEAGPVVTVYKTPTCGCCTLWEDHLRENGFQVVSHAISHAELDQVKVRHGLPAALGSCHTGIVDGYVVEGHVPADVIHRLLAERPAVDGITVPGMPMGSPGMEGPFTEPYEVFTFREGRAEAVYEVR